MEGAQSTIDWVLDRLYFTESDEANALIASDPMALLVGFELDQRVTVMKAFQGPLALKERLGAIDAATLASADLEPVFFARPVIHRYPRSMAKRVHELAVHVRDRYDGDAARIWTDATDSDELRANIDALPGFGEMKTKSLGAVLFKHFGVEAARELVPPHPDAGRRRFAAGARGLPGGQERPQGRVGEAPGRHLTGERYRAWPG